MKKIITFFIISIFFLGSVFAYTPNNEDKTLLNKIYAKIDTTEESKLIKISNKIDELKTQFKPEGRFYYVLDRMQSYINGDIETEVLIKHEDKLNNYYNICNINKPSLLDEKYRNFRMGFTTWAYGPTEEDINKTYNFIEAKGDIILDQFNEFVPWDSFIYGTDLPEELTQKVLEKKLKKPFNKKYVLSLMPLDQTRSKLSPDIDGGLPYGIQELDFANKKVQNALIDYYSYMIDELDPDYLIGGQEVNELLDNSGIQAWKDYQKMMAVVREALKMKYPDLKYSESVTLHKMYNVSYFDEEQYKEEIENYINDMDFIAISFYPFLANMHSQKDFQKALDYLHDFAEKPIAFTETTDLGEPLIIESMDMYISSSQCEQFSYLNSLTQNAQEQNYEFVIFWTFKDYDELRETFPEESKDVGKIWRDTGLIDENDAKRKAFYLWDSIYSKKLK